MGPIPISQYGETKFAIAISQQKRCVSRHTAAVRDVVIAIAYLGPPRQAEARSLVAPYVFDGSLELIVLPREHLIQSRLTDESFVFERAAIQIRNQPVRLIEHRAVHNARGPYRSFQPYGSHLTSRFFVNHIRN